MFKELRGDVDDGFRSAAYTIIRSDYSWGRSTRPSRNGLDLVRLCSRLGENVRRRNTYPTFRELAEWLVEDDRETEEVFAYVMMASKRANAGYQRGFHPHWSRSTQFNEQAIFALMDAGADVGDYLDMIQTIEEEHT